VRRALLAVPWLLVACAHPPTTAGAPAAAEVHSGADPSFAVRAVGCVGVTVGTLDRSVAFFRDVLDFTDPREEVLSGAPFGALDDVPGERARRVRLELGHECVELSEPLGGIRRPVPADSRSDDRWFQHVAIVVRDMDTAFARLEAHGVVHASVAPQTLPAWNAGAAGIRAYYFKDPDGHTLEAIWFPPGKGAARWHEPPGDHLFLGIDHTAIAAGDTQASLAFYVGRLGLHVAGGSENYGPEQERLNAVPGAHLRITTLRADEGPGIELLEYLAPRSGRPMPADERADDAVHWRTTLFAPAPLSPRSLRDPDGHVMEIHPR
jgi:catechol 2,3-dioxygenase-like lactoylglutathione lyase family enzyme